MEKHFHTFSFIMYTLAVVVIISMALTSCSHGMHGSCYAYQNVEIEQK
jgi:hypothetical protein